MSEQMKDEWYAQMHDLQADVTKRAVNECTRLRARVRELEAVIASGPSLLTELQDRIVLLESELKAREAA